MAEELNDKVQRYYAAREAYEAAKAESDRLYRERQRTENETIDAMIETGLSSMKMLDGTSIVLKKSVTCSVTKDNFDAIRGWLLDTVGDDTDFTEEVVSKPAVLELLRTKLASGELEPHEVPEFLNLNTRPTLSVTGFNARRKK